MPRKVFTDQFYKEVPGLGWCPVGEIDETEFNKWIDGGLTTDQLIERTYEQKEECEDNSILIGNRTLKQVRALGFPYPRYSKTQLLNNFQRLKKIKDSDLIDSENVLHPHRRYSIFATQFFKHYWSTRCDHFPTAIESWNDDKYLKRALENGKKYHGDGLTMSLLRNILKFSINTRVVSNFNPEIAKFLYNRYGNKGKVFDYALGWGGRLMGFLASDCKEYVGVDVNKANFPCYQELYDTFREEPEKTIYKFTEQTFEPKKARFVCQGSELFCEYQDYFDFSFSSPAYFCKEWYSDDPEQSCNKFTQYQGWVDGFLYPTIKNSLTMLKPGGYFGINIQDVDIGSKTYPLVEDTEKICKDLWLDYVETLNMSIATGFGIDKEKHGEKYEPIMIFQKPKK